MADDLRALLEGDEQWHGLVSSWMHDERECVRCGATFREIDNIGRWRCAQHAVYDILPPDGHRWPCCGAQVWLGGQGAPPPLGAKTIGCVRADHNARDDVASSLLLLDARLAFRMHVNVQPDERARRFVALDDLPLPKPLIDHLSAADRRPLDAAFVPSPRSGGGPELADELEDRDEGVVIVRRFDWQREKEVLASGVADSRAPARVTVRGVAFGGDDGRTWRHDTPPLATTKGLLAARSRA